LCSRRAFGRVRRLGQRRRSAKEPNPLCISPNIRCHSASGSLVFSAMGILLFTRDLLVSMLACHAATEERVHRSLSKHQYRRMAFCDTQGRDLETSPQSMTSQRHPAITLLKETTT
jgi:hypothetical protein